MLVENTLCLTLQRFCFLSTNAVQMTRNDHDNTKSACLSSYLTVSTSMAMFCQILLDHPPHQSSIEALLLIGNLLFCFVFFFTISAPFNVVKLTLLFSLIYCPRPLTGHPSPCFFLHVNAKGVEETGKGEGLSRCLTG